MNASTDSARFDSLSSRLRGLLVPVRNSQIVEWALIDGIGGLTKKGVSVIVAGGNLETTETPGEPNAHDTHFRLDVGERKVVTVWSEGDADTVGEGPYGGQTDRGGKHKDMAGRIGPNT